MFQNVRQNSPFYILEKGDEPKLSVAIVDSVSNPSPRYATSYPMQGFGNQEMVVDVSVRIGEEKREFKQLPANMSIANFGSSNIVVSDDRSAMIAEIESYKNASDIVLGSIPGHRRVVEEASKMLLTLNPQLAKEKATEERIFALEGQVTGISENLDKVIGMLHDALEQKKMKKGE